MQFGIDYVFQRRQCISLTTAWAEPTGGREVVRVWLPVLKCFQRKALIEENQWDFEWKGP